MLGLRPLLVAALCLSCAWALSSCLEARRLGLPSGMTAISRNGANVDVWCEQDFQGGSWEVLLNNVDATGDLLSDKLWTDYQSGVGSAVHNSTNNWMVGLEDWHLLTQRTEEDPIGFEVMVRGLRHSSGDWEWQLMDGFSIGNNASNYLFSGITQSIIGTLPGSNNPGATGVLGYSSGQPFTTSDRDNDNYGGNCAQTYNTGWWYNACHHGTLTAPIDVNGAADTNFLTVNGAALDAAQLMIREVSYFPSCQAARLHGLSSGVTTIRRNGATAQVWCEQDIRGGAWEVLLNNVDQTGDLLSDKLWAQYKSGVGNAVHDNTTNWMLGLDDWHLLTQTTDDYPSGFEVMIRGLRHSSGDWEWQSMGGFSIGNEASNYLFTGIIQSICGTLPGLNNPGATGILGYSSGRPFTTSDRDNDNYGGNCAQTWGTGWWHNSCHHGTLTAPIDATGAGDPSSLTYALTSTFFTLLAAQLMIRPVSYFPSEPIGGFTPSTSSCQEVRLQGLPSGAYWLQRNGANVQVWCGEMDDTEIGPGWETLFSRGAISDDVVGFNAGFDQYATGINRGPLQNVTDTFFVGLNAWNKLTQVSADFPTGFDLGFALQDSSDGLWKFATYGGVLVGDLASNFQMSIQGNGAGSAGWEGFQNHLVQFSAPDADHDASSGSCADVHNSGWWFWNCENGLLTAPSTRAQYYDWAGSFNLKAARIMIRPSSIPQVVPVDGDDTPVFSSCKQAQSLGRPSGPEWISRNDVTVKLFCNQISQGGGWEVLLNRHSLYNLVWDQAWVPYKAGINNGAFGATDDYWVGLRDWNALTQSTTHLYPDGYELAMFVELSDDSTDKLPDDEQWRWQIVPNIQIGSDLGNTPFQITGDWAEQFGTIGVVTGQMPDMAFSTLGAGNDNEAHPSHCADVYNSGWWFKGCHNVVLTGSRPSSFVIFVDGSTSHEHALQGAMMAIRPITSSEVSLETCMLADMQTRLEQIQLASNEILQSFNATFACQQASSTSPQRMSRWCSIRR